LRNAETLNRECQCTTTDLAVVRDRIDDAQSAAAPIVQTHPHLFTDSPVFLERRHFEQMQRVVSAVEEIVQHPGYREMVLAEAPAIARRSPANPGVFLGFDFHIAPEGPKLIEINTNAGGAFLNIAARDAQIACCEAAVDGFRRLPATARLEQDVVAMFQREWRLARGDAPLRTLAIVDENPTGQFLYPEFQLARQLFESHGIRARIADVSALQLDGDQLGLDGESVDLVYNRSTDFYLAAPASVALRAAFERDLAVITPHPHAHALYANKRNLALLSNARELSRLGVEPGNAQALAAAVPATRCVEGGEEDWWRDRKAWFFKPTGGFGSRGAYRGDKMTRRVISEVMKNDYVAQQLVPPGERHLRTPGGTGPFKVDIRCYAYAGEIQLTVARVYQGQTTNFRSAGGGFAAVHLVDGEDRTA
jgi:hypothetical protein